MGNLNKKTYCYLLYLSLILERTVCNIDEANIEDDTLES